LNTQAFYAAETGVNDAINAIRNGTISGTSTSCETPATLGTTTIDSGLGVDYSCVLIDTRLTDIKKDDVPVSGRGQAFIMPLEADSGGPIARLTIEWDSPTNATLPAAAIPTGDPRLPTTANWGASTMGGLRIDVTPTAAGANLDRTGLYNNTMTFYALPQRSGSGFTAVPVNVAKGQIIVGQCVDPAADSYRCATTVNLSPAGAASYIMRISSIYGSTRVWVSPKNASGGSVVLRNAQAIIDSTGRTADVFRRIQERVPVNSEFSNYESASFVIENGNSICKRLRIYPGMSSSPDLECSIN
jgi:hypothetical protein